MRPTCPLTRALRGPASAHACIHMCQVRKRCFARGASLAFQCAQDDSMPNVRACVRAGEGICYTREKEGNKQLDDEKGTRGEGRKKQPRKRVSLTNATRDRSRRVIITHLSPVGSGSPAMESASGTPLGPAHRAPAAPRRGSASFSHLLRLWLHQRDHFFYTLMIFTDYLCVYVCVFYDIIHECQLNLL